MRKTNFKSGISLPMVVIGVGAIALAIIGYLFIKNQFANNLGSEAEKNVVLESSGPETRQTEASDNVNEAAVAAETIDEEKDSDNESNNIKYVGPILAGDSAPLLDFTRADYEAALKSDKLVVLYFFANWCPICRAEFPLMEQAFNDITHDQVVGFRVNFNDSDTDGDEVSLARQYGVAYQHTKVFVKNGQRILKSPESWPKDRYLSEIKKALAK